MKKDILLLIGLLLIACSSMAGTKKEPQMKRVYMFGFAASFTDSLAYQTDIQRVDSAWIDEHKFLVDRSLYSLQLQYHIESKEQKRNTTCTVFFNTSRRRLERTWRKVNKRYKHAEGLHLTTLPQSSFAFKAEEYRPIIIEDDTTQTEAKPPVTKAPTDGPKAMNRPPMPQPKAK